MTVNEIQTFQDCLDICQGKDIHAIGSFFTWNNKQEVATRVYSRIDRFMVNDDWLYLFPDAYANFMPEGIFDHCPCVVQFTEQVQRRKGAFKYFNMWSMHPEFETVIRDHWQNSIEGTLLFQLTSKLKMLKYKLKMLNKDSFNDIENNTAIVLMALHNVQKDLRAQPMDPTLIETERALSKEYALMMEAKHQFLAQKAKAEWVADGDDNTSYFHASIRAHKNKSKVVHITDMNGNCQSSAQDEVIDWGDAEAVDALSSADVGVEKSVVDEMSIASSVAFVHVPTVQKGKFLTDDLRQKLLKPITGEEIRRAKFFIPGTKAPGPDGYNSQFF
ncbi:uncharacterized protein LOC141630179 [Silene latifolia]|uniref:uncharacterized protein LOC141630179 n=1 Tax=Silene latifolia TaxID=37657 RepID=UPI003D76C9B4